MMICKHSSLRRLLSIIVIAVTVALLLLASVPVLQAAPEAPSVEWSKTYSGLQGNSVIQTSDGGFALAGSSFSGTAAFIKTDSSGNVQWQKAYGSAASVVQTSDLGYVLFCENGLVVKTDSEGNFQSSIQIGLNGVKAGALAREGNYLLIGNSQTSNGESFAWLRKIDPQGNLLWNKTFTGGFTVNAFFETDDRGCALAGNWKTDFWLGYIDSNGNLQWSQTYSYGGTLDTHIVYSLVKTNDGGYVLAGAGDWQASGGQVPWLVRLNSQGHELWSLPYGQFPNDRFSAVVQANNEGFLTAEVESPALVRMDASGSDFWRLPLSAGFRPSSLIRTSDGGFAVTGTDSGGNTFLEKTSPETDLTPPVVTVFSPQRKTYETEIPVTFRVNEAASWLGYSLDGQVQVTIAGNTTLSGLSVGAHNLTIYARDPNGLVGSSDTIQFTVAAPFPTALVLGGIAVAAFAAFSLWLYLKRQSLAAYRKKGLSSFLKRQNIEAFAGHRLVWTLTIFGLCALLIFVQIFFPYFYFSSGSRNSGSPFEVGVTYVYEQDGVGQIYDQLSRINALGFNVVRVNLVSNSLNPNDYSNSLTEAFYRAVQQFNLRVALIISNHDTVDNVDYYLGRWGKYLTYVQVLNEPETGSSWDVGALFTDDEIISKFDQMHAVVEQHQLSAQLYTNFGPGFIVRTNLPVQFSGKLDFVGFDVFMDSFLTLSPNMVQMLRKATNKEIVISEFGMSTFDDQAQSDYIIKGLDLFKSMGLRGCWLVYWNSVDNSYGIRGRLAEQKVGEWIAKSA